MEMYERIKLLRTEELHLTQTEFGEHLGVKRDVINNIENNRLKNPSKQEPLYRLICQKFDVNEEWLRTGNGEMFIEVDKENLLMMWAADVLKDESDSFKRRFVKMLSQLEESDWKVLERMAIMLHSENEEN